MLKKLLSLAMVLLMVLQICPLCAHAAKLDTDADYTGKYLAAINTNSDIYSYETFSAYCPEEDFDVEAAEEEPEAAACYDAGLGMPQILSPAEALRKQAALGKNAPECAPADYHVGNVKTIHSEYIASKETRRSSEVRLTCLYTGSRCTVWHESTSEEAAAAAINLGEYFDEEIPLILDLFGDKRIDTDKDGKIALFIYTINKENTGGFFSPFDLIDSVGRLGNVWVALSKIGNQCDCVHIDSEWDTTQIKAATIHEYQHYINTGYLFTDNNNFTIIRSLKRYFEERYLDEGFSAVSEYLLCDWDRYTGSFSEEASLYSTNSVLDYVTNRTYSLAYVFCQYIRTRYAQMIGESGEKAGKEIYKIILESRTKYRGNTMLGMIADMLYPKADYPELKKTDARSRQLLTDFWLAVFSNEPTGVHGFNDEEWAKNLNPDSLVEYSLPREGSREIRGGMAAFYCICSEDVGTAKVTSADRDLVFVGIDQVGYKLSFDANGGGNAPYPLTMRTEYILLTYDPIRPGYSFDGWALEPDAEQAALKYGDTITLTEDTTLYAVWKTAPRIEQGTEYFFEETEPWIDTVDYCFVPEQSGIYAVRYSSVCMYLGDVMFCSEGELRYADCVYCADSHRSWVRLYKLDAGTMYNITFRPCSDIGETTTSFSVELAENCRKLTLYSNLPGETEPIEQYTLSEVILLDEYPSSVETGQKLAGWAESADAASAQYQSGDWIDMEHDRTLYAVWAPIPKIELNKAVKEKLSDKSDSSFIYSFVPQTDGMYTLQIDCAAEEFSAYSYLLDSEGFWLTSGSDCEESMSTYALESGKQYYFELYVNGSFSGEIPLTVTLRKTSDQTACTLHLDAGEDNVGDFTMTGKSTYTIPDYSPVSLQGQQFYCWKDDMVNCYMPGDTITINQDTTLQAVWINSGRQDLHALFTYVWNAIVLTIRLYFWGRFN